MTRKYTPLKKKKNHQPAHTVAQVSTTPPVAAEISVSYATTAQSAPAAVDAARYENLPRELRRVALFSAVALVIMIVLWLVLR